MCSRNGRNYFRIIVFLLYFFHAFPSWPHSYSTNAGRLLTTCVVSNDLLPRENFKGIFDDSCTGFLSLSLMLSYGTAFSHPSNHLHFNSSCVLIVRHARTFFRQTSSSSSFWSWKTTREQKKKSMLISLEGSCTPMFGSNPC